MAEREQRLDPLRVVPAVTDVETLGVDGVPVDAGVLLGSLGRQVGLRLRERLRELAGGVDVSEEDRGDRVPVLDSRVPGLDDPRHLVDPRHQHRPASVEHDDGLRVRLRDRRDQLILVIH